MQKKYSGKISLLTKSIDGFRVCGGEKPSTPLYMDSIKYIEYAKNGFHRPLDSCHFSKCLKFVHGLGVCGGRPHTYTQYLES